MGWPFALFLTHPLVCWRTPPLQRWWWFVAGGRKDKQQQQKQQLLLLSSTFSPPRLHFSPPTTRLPSPPPSLAGVSQVFLDGDVISFVEMLSSDNNPLVREQAMIELSRYIVGGKQYVDAIMRCCGFLDTILCHLRSELSSTCEAAAGILRTISDANEYKNLVVESGAVEVITDLLSNSSFTSEGKEQCLCVLLNLSVCNKFDSKVGNKLLLSLVKLLDDDDMKVKEATTRVVANMVLSEDNQSILMEAGVITKLANMVNIKSKECKIIRKEAKKALHEFSKDECNRILVLEEGFVLVPVIGAAAYKSFKPTLHSWPSLPDGTIFEQKANQSSEYGAAGLLLGLNIDECDTNLEEMKIKAIDGRARQQFLVRAEAIETDEVDDSHSERPINQRYALLPWVDGVARLVMILGLEDLSAVSRAADSIADASVNEHMRLAFKEAGALNHLLCLLNHQDSSVQSAAIRAIERLSASDYVCDAIVNNSLCHLIDVLIQPHLPEFLTEKVLDVFYRIFEPKKRPLLSKFSGAVLQSNSKNGDLDISIAAATSDGMNRRGGVESDLIVPLISILKTYSSASQWKAASILGFLLGVESPGVVEEFISAGIESALTAVFQQNVLEEDFETLEEVEESGLAISASSSLLKELLKYEVFLSSVNLPNLTHLLTKTMASRTVPLRHKHHLGAALMSLAPRLSPEPAEIGEPHTLIEQMKASPLDPQLRRGLMREVNRITSRADGGVVKELVKLVEGDVDDDDPGSRSGLEILHGLSLDRVNRPALASAGVVQALRRYLFCGKRKEQKGRILALLILKIFME